MRNRYWTVAALFVVCIGIVLGVLALLPPRPGVTKVNFDRIEIGMTEKEVGAMLGGPGNCWTMHLTAPGIIETKIWACESGVRLWPSHGNGIATPR